MLKVKTATQSTRTPMLKVMAQKASQVIHTPRDIILLPVTIQKMEDIAHTQKEIPPLLLVSSPTQRD